ncbi:transposase [Streptomyces rubiginosohelvolus]|uniref:IS701 family transposase n=1 Tax=Streptomyces rubiginosohelvolus TaxID=67362 RepID=UPI0034323648
MDNVLPTGPPRRPISVDAPVLADLCTTVFASLPRSDQRERAHAYVRALLTTEGRKTFRNMARGLGGGTTLEQRLHHFVSCSTWDWAPVRGALSAVMEEAAAPDAWVLRPVVVAKDGNGSVGVHRRYAPAQSRMVNVQYAVGLWSANGDSCHPLNWRLLLPRSWTDDPELRDRGAIPPSVRSETPGECAVRACLEVTADRPVRPVVAVVDEAEAIGVIQQLRSAGLPFLVRAGRGVPIAVVGQDPDRPASARRLLATARGLAPGDGPGQAVRVRSASRAARPDSLPGADELLLLGGDGTDDGPWLTDMADTPVPQLTALTALARRADHGLEQVTGRLGVRDFTGRTFTGWHRHMTLVSVAHCAVRLTELTGGLGPAAR